MNYTIADGEVGKIYYSKYEKNVYIFKIKSGSFDRCEVFGWITPLNKTFNNIALGFISLWMPEMRLATPEEAEHLEQCIQAGKYVEYKKEELPEKWQIKRTPENYEVINEWMNKHHSSLHAYNIYNSRRGFANNFNKSKVDEGFTEITFDQFKRLVLKETNNMNKKIIGYKLIKEMPLLPIGTQFDWDEENQDFVYNRGQKDEHYYTQEDIDKTSGWFTPIYEEEFKELVLKEQDMKIIGYKLLKPYPGLTVGEIYKSHEFQDNTEWFEPQYEQQKIEKGAWVTCLNTETKRGNQKYSDHDGKGSGWQENLTFKVTNIDDHNSYIVYWGGYLDCGVYDNFVRLATQEEIKEALKIKIGNYEAVITKNKVTFGCNVYTKEDVQSLLTLMSKENSSIKAVQVYRDILVKKQDLQRIANAINESTND